MSSPTIASAHTWFRRALTTIACGALLLPTTLASPASADDDRRHDRLSDLRVCDLSACYLAVGVVDSDGDGVADADETALGYDPLDPASTPPLSLVLDATIDGKLPTYELGYGTWAVFPEDFVKGLEKKWLNLQELPGGIEPSLPSEVFGIPTRRGSIALAGIDDGLLKGLGIEAPWKTGLTFGLTLDSGGKEMGIDLGRFNGSWYGAYDGVTAWWAASHGGEKNTSTDNGTRYTEYGDGSSSTTKAGTPGCEELCTSSSRTEYYDPELNKAGESTDEAYYDLSGRYHTERTQRDQNGKTVRETETVHTKNKDGSTTITKDTTEYERDKNGKTTGTTKTRTERTVDKNGKETSSTTKTQKCDAKGENCTDAMTTGDEGTGLALPGTAWLSHKEAAAALDKLFTMKGSTVTPVQDAPSVIGVLTDDDVKAALRHRDLISLFAGDDISTHVGATVLGTGWNTAAPESRPDLPSPLDGATGGGGAPGSGGCSSGGGTC
ncbi:thrombospondin type 3 repeat-containing protein [Micromonospora sp. S-DT3-3-22]|nr:thrombospondin type 3 repeat-containing protein [Micromonospora sp. S-DT3-3-22]